MKNCYFKCYWLTGLLIIFSQYATAYDFKQNGICYRLTSVPLRTVSVTSNNAYYEGDIVIPATVVYSDVEFSVTAIDDNAFGNWSAYGLDGSAQGENLAKLTSVKFPSTLKRIGRSAFQGCDGLTNISIPSSVELIDSMAFGNCHNIETVVIEDGDEDLTGTIPCKNLYLGRNVKSRYWDYYNHQYVYNDAVFYGVTSATIGKKAQRYGFTGELSEVHFEEGCTVIPDKAFFECKNLESIMLPNTIQTIGSSAFQGCEVLANLVIPESVKHIGSQAFAGCIAVSSISLPNDVTIGTYLFEDCENLQTVRLSSKITEIPEGMFKGCRNLQPIEFPVDLALIGDYAFENCYFLMDMVLPDNVILGNGVFSGCHSMTKVNIPQGNTRIGTSLFKDCWSLRELTIPTGIEIIEEEAFKGAFKDAPSVEIKLPEGLTKICRNAFTDCGISSISFPTTLTKIGQNAFDNSTRLKTISFAASNTSIEDYAFNRCEAIESIYSLMQFPVLFSDNVFSNMTYLLATLYLPENSIDIYASTNGWRNFIKVQTYTGIHSVLTNDGISDEYYTLSGMRVEKLQKGIYIIDKKIVVVK